MPKVLQDGSVREVVAVLVRLQDHLECRDIADSTSHKFSTKKVDNTSLFMVEQKKQY